MLRKSNEHTKFLLKNANWILKFESLIFQLHQGYPPVKPETLVFWDSAFEAWPWTTWAPLMPSELNLAALTRTILTIKFRNPTRPPQIIKPSSKKPGKCVKASVPWTITHLHGCSLTDKSTSATPSSTPHSQLSPFYSRFSVLPADFHNHTDPKPKTDWENSEVRSCNSNNLEQKQYNPFNIATLHPANFHKRTDPENRLRKFGDAKVQFQQCRRKVLNSFSFYLFNIAPLHPANFHNHRDPENRLRKFGSAKVQFQQRRRKVLSSFSFHPSNIAPLHPANFHNHRHGSRTWVK